MRICLNELSCDIIIKKIYVKKKIKREIKIARRIKEDNVIYNIQEDEILNTFWHEVFHSFQYYWNNKCDEDFAQVLSNFMCELEQTKEY